MYYHNLLFSTHTGVHHHPDKPRHHILLPSWIGDEETVLEERNYLEEVHADMDEEDRLADLADDGAGKDSDDVPVAAPVQAVAPSPPQPLAPYSVQPLISLLPHALKSRRGYYLKRLPYNDNQLCIYPISFTQCKVWMPMPLMNYGNFGTVILRPI